MSSPSAEYAEAYNKCKQKLIETLRQQLSDFPLYVEQVVIKCGEEVIDTGDDELQAMLKSIPVSAIANVTVKKKVV